MRAEIVEVMESWPLMLRVRTPDGAFRNLDMAEVFSVEVDGLPADIARAVGLPATLTLEGARVVAVVARTG